MRNTKEKILSILMLLALMANNLLYPINYVTAEDFSENEIMSEVSASTENETVENVSTDGASDSSENLNEIFDDNSDENDVVDG